MGNWVKVKAETGEANLPPEGVPVIVTFLGYNDQEPCIGMAVLRWGGWNWWAGSVEDSEEEVIVEITHWMLAPQPVEQ